MSVATTGRINPVEGNIDRSLDNSIAEPTENDTPESKEKQIFDLIDQINNREWRETQESARLEMRYGEGSLGKLRQWLGGEEDFTYDPESGEVIHNVGTEVLRRTASFAWKSARSAAVILGMGVLTGGVGAIPATTIFGSTLGRGVAEILKGFVGKEDALRKDLLIARENYYKKIEAIAAEIAEHKQEGSSGRELEDYQTWRAEKINQIVNIAKEAEGKTIRKKQMALNKNIERWRVAEEMLAAIGGVAGGISAMLHEKARMVSEIHRQLANRQSVRLDLDLDGISHNVSLVDQGIKITRHLADNYVFSYNSFSEAATAQAAGATILPQGIIGSHVLGGNLSVAVGRMAGEKVFNIGFSTFFGLATAATVERTGNKWSLQREAKSAPSSFDDVSKLVEQAKEKEKPVREPAKGETWIYKSKNGKEITVKIIGVDKRTKDAETVTFRQEDKKREQKMFLVTFLASGARLVSEREVRKLPEKSENIVEKTRQAANYTLENVENYDDLNAENETNADKKFKEISREIWNKFVVHGTIKWDERHRKFIVKNDTDLDGRAAIGLFQLAGFKTDDLKFVSPSDYIAGRVNLDTGDRDGVIFESDDAGNKSLFFDHHANNSKTDISAALLVYETLAEMGFLKKDLVLEKAVNFIVELDNCRFIVDESSYRQLAGNLCGLGRCMTFENLIQFFRDGKNPAEQLSAEDIEKYDLVEAVGRQESIVKNSEKYLRIAEAKNYTLESPRYGKILIDIGNTIPGGFDAVRAFGYDTYIIWDTKHKSFFISSNKGIQDKFPGAKIIRSNMSMKPRQDPAPLKTNLSGILKTMTDGKLEPTGKLAEYLGKEKK